MILEPNVDVDPEDDDPDDEFPNADEPDEDVLGDDEPEDEAAIPAAALFWESAAMGRKTVWRYSRASLRSP